MNNPKIKAAAIALIMALMTTAVDLMAAGEGNPVALSMGGAYTALARDLDAPSWNPANLGLSDGGSYSIGIFNVGVSLRNNSFSLYDYNRYNGAALSESDKDDILNSIPASGLELDLLAEASALNFSVGNWALTYKATGASNVAMDKDPIRLFFYGNAVVRNVSINNTRGEAYGMADFALSYGRAIQRWEGGEFTAGASVHYLKGLAYQRIVEATGGVSTTDTGFVGSGVLRFNSALGGSGYSIDLGTAVRFEDDWYFSATWQNFASKMNWSNETEENLYTFQMDPITADMISNSGDEDSLVTTTDSTYAIGGFSSKFPGIFRMGIARKYSNLMWAFDLEQSFSQAPQAFFILLNIL